MPRSVCQPLRPTGQVIVLTNPSVLLACVERIGCDAVGTCQTPCHTAGRDNKVRDAIGQATQKKRFLSTVVPRLFGDRVRHKCGPNEPSENRNGCGASVHTLFRGSIRTTISPVIPVFLERRTARSGDANVVSPTSKESEITVISSSRGRNWVV